jgi:transcription antitermination protein NusB
MSGPDQSKTKPKADFRARTTARLGAVQVLYSVAINPDRRLEQAVREYLDAPPVDPDTADEGDALLVPPAAELLSKIARGSHAQAEDLDGLIDPEISPPWSPERIEPLLRCLLRAGAYELLAHSEFDTKLLIKEYMTVADGFFSEREPALVNAVLDRVAKKLRG